MNRSRIFLFVAALAVVSLTVMVWAGWSAMQRSAGMVPAALSPGAYDSAAPGEAVKLVMEVGQADGKGRLSGKLLVKDGTAYRRSATRVEAQLTADSAVVMGSGAGIKPGAVLQLSGRMEQGHRLRVARVVVLSGYVTVAR